MLAGGNAFAQDIYQQQSSTAQQNIYDTPSTSTASRNISVGDIKAADNGGGGEADGSPLPIDTYQYGLMAVGMALAAYFALKGRKQNA